MTRHLGSPPFSVELPKEFTAVKDISVVLCQYSSPHVRGGGEGRGAEALLSHTLSYCSYVVANTVEHISILNTGQSLQVGILISSTRLHGHCNYLNFSCFPAGYWSGRVDFGPP